MTIMQVDAEIDGLADIFRAEGVRSFLEIGSKFGGSLERLATAMPTGSRVVSVDLPRGTRAWPQSEAELKATVSRLRMKGYDTHLIWGDSTAPDVIAKVKALGPFDGIFIDANHTRPYLWKDWENYGPIGQIVAFHDIAWRRGPDWSEGIRIDAPELWGEIKEGYRHQELKFCPTGKNNGIGVLWRD